MELLEAIQSRRSIRKFQAKPVADSLIKELIEAARLAPSGSNLQPTRFVVIKSEEARARLKEASPLPFVSQAPVVIACCADSQSFGGMGTRARELQEAGAFADTPLEKMNPDEYAKRRPLDPAYAEGYLRLNAAIAIDHMTLRAMDLGLGTCWVMMFDQKKAKEIIGLDDNYSVVALLPVGYPDQNPGPRPRLDYEKLLLKEI